MKNKIKTLISVSTFVLLSATQSFAQDDAQLPDFEALIEQGRYDEARAALLTVSRNLGDLIFIEVQILIAQGRVDDAIELLDEVLLEFPDFYIGRAKLAQLLVQDRQYGRAQYQYELLRDRTENEEDRTFFSEQLQEISSIQPYNFSLQASIVPSNNINNGTTEKEYCAPKFEGNVLDGETCKDTPPELAAQFGWHTQLNASGTYIWNIADQHSLEFGINGVINHYSVDTLENKTAGISVDYVFQNANDRFSFGTFLSNYWGDGKSYTFLSDAGAAEIFEENEDYKTRGVSASYRHIIDRNSSIRLSATHRRSEYEDNDIVGNYKNIYSATYNYFVDERRSWNLSLGTTVFRQEADVIGDSEARWTSSGNYRAVNLGIGYNHLFENNWFLGANVNFEVEDHNDRAYPGTADTYRQDKIFQLGLEARNQDWKVGNSVPSLSCNISKSVSNIQNKNTGAFSCGVYFTNKF